MSTKQSGSNKDKTTTNLSCKGTPLEKSIDIACRRPERDAALFVAFVRDAVWDRLEVKSEP